MADPFVLAELPPDHLKSSLILLKKTVFIPDVHPFNPTPSDAAILAL